MNRKQIIKLIKFILFIGMLVLIYILSPILTQNIQNICKYISELESNYITRIIELVLSVSLVACIFTVRKK